MPFAARKTKKQKGFTLPEVLVVVALIAVLLTFAVIAILGYVRRLKLHSLDTDAETIFMAAQDRLTAMANAGELDQLKTDLTFSRGMDDAEPDPDTTGGALLLNYLDSVDANKTGGDDVAMDLASILPFGSIESRLRAGHYVIEFSKRTGTVYGVWYTDEDGFDYTTYVPPTTTAAGRTEAEKFETRRDKDPLVGFYGGTAVDRPTIETLPIPRVSLLNAEVLRLRVGVELPAGSSLGTKNVTVHVGVRESASNDNKYLELIFDPDSSDKVIDASKATNKLALQAGSTVYGDVLLDAAYPDAAKEALYNKPGFTNRAEFTENGVKHTTTLLGCRQFREWVHYTTLEKKKLITSNGNEFYPAGYYTLTTGAEQTNGVTVHPGQEITVAVWLTYFDEGRDYSSETVYVNANSLFSALEKGTDAHGDTTYTAKLTYCRHLQNLCAHVNGVYDPTKPHTNNYLPFLSGLDLPKLDPTTGEPKTKRLDPAGHLDGETSVTALTGATLIRDLDFVNTDVDDPARSWMECYTKDSSDPGAMPHLFESIYCNSYMDLTSFDGSGLSIKNLNTNATDTPDSDSSPADKARQAHSGLFGMIISTDSSVHCSIKNLTMIDCRALGGKSVGTLAGVAQLAYITACRVYLESGIPEPLATNPAPEAFVEVKGSGSEIVAGGLIGKVNHCTLTSCSAATVVKGSNTEGLSEGTGGLVGLASYSSGVTSSIANALINCHAACYLEGAHVGGLVGYKTYATTLTNCYAAGYIAKATEAAGLIASDPGHAEGSFPNPAPHGAPNTCYAAVRYGPDLIAAAKATPATATIYGTSMNPASLALYVEQSDVPYQTAAAGSYGTPKTADELKAMIGAAEFPASGNWFVPDGATSAAPGTNPTYAVFPYYMFANDEDSPAPPYPYPQLAMKVVNGKLYASEDPELPSGTPTKDVPMVHYGDWLEDDSKLPELCAAYVETYVKGDGTNSTDVGVYAAEADAGGRVKATVNALLTTAGNADSKPEERLYAASAAYCILSPEELDTGKLKDYTLDGNTPTSNLTENGTVDVDGVLYYRYDFDDSLLVGSNYYHTLVIGSGSDARTFLLNTQYACEAIDVTEALKDNPGLLTDDGGAILKKPLHQTTPAGTTTAVDTVYIRTPAQLACVGIETNSTDAAAAAAARQRAYVQTINIDYALYKGTMPDTETAAAVEARNKAKYEATPNQAPIRLECGSYDGSGYAIKSMVPGAIFLGANDTTVNSGEQRNVLAGMFGYVTGGTLKDIRLINSRVQITATGITSNTSSSYRVRLGTLAGYIDPRNMNATCGPVSISGCGAFVEPDSPTVTDACATAADAYDRYTVRNVYDSSTNANSKNDYAGGLIGAVLDPNSTNDASNITISKCFSAVKVEGVVRAGGFAGALRDCTVSDSYTGGHTDNGTYYKGSAALVNVLAENPDTADTDRFAGGFVGELTGSNTFTGVVYTTASAGLKTGSHKNGSYGLGQFDGRNTGTAVTAGATVYATGALFENGAVSSTLYPDTDDGKEWKADAFLNGAATTLHASTTADDGIKAAAYDDLLVNAGAKYPFTVAEGQTVHHGDWAKRLILAYYEIYADSNGPAGIDTPIIRVDSKDYHVSFYSTFINAAGNEQTVNTLRYDDAAIVYRSGYMVISTERLDQISFLLESVYYDSELKADKRGTGDPTTLLASNAIFLTADYKGRLDGTTSLVDMGTLAYPIPYDAVNVAPGNDYYLKATINGDTYLMNPHFACEVVNVEPGKTVGDEYVLDTKTIRAKKDLNYNEHKEFDSTKGRFTTTEKHTNETVSDGIIVRSALHLASLARYTREGNEATSRDGMREQKYYLMLNIDASLYRKGEVFDGATGNRIEPGRDAWYAGQYDMFGQVGAILSGSGLFEGYGHTIRNLYLGHDTGNITLVGLFASVSGDATVQNFTLENTHVNAGDEKSYKESDGTVVYLYYDVGTVAAQLGGNAAVKNIALTGTKMEFHTVPANIKDKDFDSDKKYDKTTTSGIKEKGYNRYDEVTKAGVRFNSVGGSVGVMQDNAQLTNLYVNDMLIDLNCTKYGYSFIMTNDTYKDNSGNNQNVSVGKAGDDLIRLLNSSTYGNDCHSSVCEDANSTAFPIGGIAGSLSGSARVETVTLIDPHINAVKGPEGLSVGGVIGRAAGNSSIEGAGAYVSEDSKYGSQVINSNKDNNVTSGTSGVGGFAGYLGKGVTAAKDFAAVQVQGNYYVGGFAGRIDGSVITSCYAGGHTVNTIYDTTTANVTAAAAGGCAGGFVGRMRAVYESGSSGVFALCMSGTNYSTCSVKAGGTDGHTGLFAADFTTDAARDLLAYTAGNNISLSVYATGTSLAGTPNDEEVFVKTGARLRAALAATKVPAQKYDNKLADEYPYQTDLPVHHGDWGALVNYTGVLYWERETDPGSTAAKPVYSWHYIAVNANGTIADNRTTGFCAKVDGKAVEAGYAVFAAPDMLPAPVITSGDEDTSSDNLKALQDLFGATYDFKLYACNYSSVSDGAGIDLNGDGTDDAALRLDFADTLVADKAALDALGGTEANPLQVRTVVQLQNLDSVSNKHIKQTHDLVPPTSGSDYKAPPVSNIFYYGSGYRILDLASDRGGVFNSLENSTVKYLILYSPTGKGKITSSGGDAGGGITPLMINSTLDGCVVAGYEITASGNAGGLVGHASGNDTQPNHILNSEATATVTGGGNVGGLVGLADADELTVEKSYAGGNLTGSATNAGGLVGLGYPTGSGHKNTTYKNVYSYVDMTGVNATNVYGIGIGTVETGSTLTEYWAGGLPDGVIAGDAADITGVPLAQLKQDTQTAFALPVNDMYVPDTGTESGVDHRAVGLTDKVGDTDDFSHFPFAAFVTSGAPVPASGTAAQVHYGGIPAVQTAGFYYAEKETVKTPADPTGTESWHFYIYGAEISGNNLSVTQQLLDTLCYDHHLNGERASITEPSYGVFWPKDMGFSLGTPTGAADADTGLAQALANALTLPAGQLTVQTVTANNYKPAEWRLNIPGGITNPSSSNRYISGYVSGAFAAAIGNNLIGEDGGRPVNVRTMEQFQHITSDTGLSSTRDNSIEYFTLTHDLDGKTTAGYTPGEPRATYIDGGGYRILDLNITPASGGAALFTELKKSPGSYLKNLILYSTDGTGVITSKDGNAAGLVATLASNTIENCAVAGYTITGTGYVGGIAGQMNDGGSTIKNCEAVVALASYGTNTGSGAGGITGYGRGQITGCYAGGSITGTWTKAGGIYGAGQGGGTNITLTSSYSFMDLSGVTAASGGAVYALGEKSASASIGSDCCYLDDFLPAGCVTDNQGTACGFGQMAEKAATPADYTYLSDATGLKGLTPNGRTYPLQSVVTVELAPGEYKAGDPDTVRVHYGDWPRAAKAAGIAYYELDNAGKFTYQLAVVDDAGTVLDEAAAKSAGLRLPADAADPFNTLCTDRHTGEDGTIKTDHQIAASGYVLFNGDRDALASPEALAGLTAWDAAAPAAGLTAAQYKAVQNGILSLLGGDPDLLVVYPTAATLDTVTTTEDISKIAGAKSAAGFGSASASVSQTTLYYTNGFAGVSNKAFGTYDNPFLIRTVRQLDNIPSSYKNPTGNDYISPTEGKFFEQTHDLYGENYTVNGRSSISDGDTPLYTGASGFKGTYDGKSYRILELSMQSDSNVGLFASASGALQSIVLYSPSGKAVISMNGSSTASAGGLVGTTSGKDLKITNCTVAGYTITSAGTGGSNSSNYASVGGLIGDAFQGVTITSSAAVNILQSTNTAGDIKIGGLAGRSDTNGSDYAISITNSYAGGTVTVNNAEKVYAGGILGYNTRVRPKDDNTGDKVGKVTIQNCYTYLNTKAVNANSSKVHPIYGSIEAGLDYNTLVAHNAYLASLLPTGTDAEFYENTPTDNFEDVKATTDNKAVYTYLPGSDGLKPGTTKEYPYKAVVKGKQTQRDGTYTEALVHYGTWPDASNGFSFFNLGVGVYNLLDEQATPETATPETATPETATPETAAPETATPETATPETATPESGAPEGQPSEPQPTPGEQEQQPTEPQPTPGEQEQQPTEPQPTPGEQEQQPTEPQPTPGEQEQQPAEPQPTPGEQEQQPAEPQPTPGEGGQPPAGPTPTEPSTTPPESVPDPSAAPAGGGGDGAPEGDPAPAGSGGLLPPA